MKVVNLFRSPTVWAMIDISKQVVADVHFLNVARDTKVFTDTCIGVLNRALNCDASLMWATDIGHFYDETTISRLGTSDCRASLNGYLKQVKAGCDTSRYDSPDGYSYHAGYSAELVWERFNVLCTSNAAGENCNLLLGKLAGVNPENQRRTASGDPRLMYNDCALSVLKTQMEMPLASNADLSSGLSRIASSCKTTVAVTPAPVPSPAWITWGTAPAPTPTSVRACTGKTHVIEQGDTCQSVAKQQRIKTAQLMMANNLLSRCHDFPTAAGSSLCIAALTCDPYIVKTGDTCTTIVNVAKATWAQIVSWNAELGSSCQNIGTYVSSVVCLSNPGSTSGTDPAVTASAARPITTTTPVE
ncbi:LysM domain-containing protein [Colletotrichum graminicola]|uniref:LysM domain-containing protein n=1 Tax=Colletotrichum graminicola (strain M1.001 / M2 / FGSC 10212) TaxID=645133 RepID=E3QRU8_COLGM|nr:LysM domain-containing protein [Colletotrichum graminicola M1.001]EFQ33586.1 LysM domain-containing protein [Colletotrichum graminicola M1.001]WDK10860.1 LysM domain-containing protein [Colletotrichum graminicola]